jgi:LPS sulfotransferase NodH
VISRRTTPNGVFGTKLLWAQFADHRPALRIALLQNARLIYLSRRDLAPQVVSLHLSMVTGRWGFDATTVSIRSDDVEIGDLAHLAECEARILQQQRAWRDLFAGLRVAPMELVYEDVVADQPGAVVRIAKALGLAADEYRVPPPEPRETPFPPEIEAQRHRLVAAWRAKRAA